MISPHPPVPRQSLPSDELTIVAAFLADDPRTLLHLSLCSHHFAQCILHNDFLWTRLLMIAFPEHDPSIIASLYSPRIQYAFLTVRYRAMSRLGVDSEPTYRLELASPISQVAIVCPDASLDSDSNDGTAGPYRRMLVVLEDERRLHIYDLLTGRGIPTHTFDFVSIFQDFQFGFGDSGSSVQMCVSGTCVIVCLMSLVNPFFRVLRVGWDFVGEPNRELGQDGYRNIRWIVDVNVEVQEGTWVAQALVPSVKCLSYKNGHGEKFDRVGVLSNECLRLYDGEDGSLLDEWMFGFVSVSDSDSDSGDASSDSGSRSVWVIQDMVFFRHGLWILISSRKSVWVCSCSVRQNRIVPRLRVDVPAGPRDAAWIIGRFCTRASTLQLIRSDLTFYTIKIENEDKTAAPFSLVAARRCAVPREGMYRFLEYRNSGSNVNEFLFTDFRYERIYRARLGLPGSDSSTLEYSIGSVAVVNTLHSCFGCLVFGQGRLLRAWDSERSPSSRLERGMYRLRWFMNPVAAVTLDAEAAVVVAAGFDGVVACWRLLDHVPDEFGHVVPIDSVGLRPWDFMIENGVLEGNWDPLAYVRCRSALPHLDFEMRNLVLRHTVAIFRSSFVDVFSEEDRRLEMPNGEFVTLDEAFNRRCAQETRMMRFSDISLTFPSRFRTKIIVEESDMLSAARELRQRFPKDRIGVLNFASHLVPNCLTMGHRTQEEDLHVRTNLFQCLDDLDGLDPDRTWSYPIPPDGSIVSPFVVGIRGGEQSGYPLQLPFVVSVVSTPALCRPKLRDGRMNPKDRGETRKKIVVMLGSMVEIGVVHFVGGAWGTGRYRNPPEDISELFAEVLHEELSGAFKTVRFCILQSKKALKCFSEVLSPESHIDA